MDVKCSTPRAKRQQTRLKTTWRNDVGDIISPIQRSMIARREDEPLPPPRPKLKRQHATLYDATHELVNDIFNNPERALKRRRCSESPKNPPNTPLREGDERVNTSLIIDTNDGGDADYDHVSFDDSFDAIEFYEPSFDWKARDKESVVLHLTPVTDY